MLFKAPETVQQGRSWKHTWKKTDSNKLSSDPHLHFDIYTPIHIHKKRYVNTQSNLQQRETDRFPPKTPTLTGSKTASLHSSDWSTNHLCPQARLTLFLFSMSPSHLYKLSHSEVSSSAQEFYSLSLTTYRS